MQGLHYFNIFRNVSVIATEICMADDACPSLAVSEENG